MIMILLMMCLSFETFGLFYSEAMDDYAGMIFCCIVPIALLVGIILIGALISGRKSDEKSRHEKKEEAHMSPEETKRWVGAIRNHGGVLPYN